MFGKKVAGPRVAFAVRLRAFSASRSTSTGYGAGGLRGEFFESFVPLNMKMRGDVASSMSSFEARGDFFPSPYEPGGTSFRGFA